MHSFMHHHRESSERSIPERRGAVTISAWLYDLMTQWFVMHGKEQTFRHMTADLAQLQTGKEVLDVGCGTGTLALVAKKRVGEMGRVCGIDPSAQLLVGARRKAEQAGLPIDFQLGGIEQIPFSDQSFDVVLSTFMMHHLPDDLKRQGLSEIARVLKPGGHLLVVDFKRPEEYQSQPEQFGAGAMGLQDLPVLMQEVGFSQTETGEIPFHMRSLAAGHQNHGLCWREKARRKRKGRPSSGFSEPVTPAQRKFVLR